MLYPDFNELISLKNRKSHFMHTSNTSVKSVMHGNHHSPFRGQGLEFDSVRPYVLGDDIRNIDWRVTGRTGKPHLKLFKEERERQILLCLDMNGSMRFGTRNTFKSIQAARAAALLGWKGLSSHDGIGALLFGDVDNGFQFFAPKRTHKSFVSMLKKVSEPFSTQNEISISDALGHLDKVSHTGSLIYVISDFMGIDAQSSKGWASLSRLSQRCDLIFIAINDRADKEMYPFGAVEFCGRQEKVYVDTENAAGRQLYAKLWNESREALDEMTTKCKIPLIELTTESEIHRDLPMGLQIIAKKRKR